MLSAVLLGAGRIGATLDFGAEPGAARSYVGALNQLNRIRLEAIIEPDQKARDNVSNLTSASVVRSWTQLPPHIDPDLVIVACPTAALVDEFSQVDRYFPEAHILLEKPIANSLKGLSEASAIGEGRPVETNVNFSRRYLAESYEVRDQLIQGEIGDITGVEVRYSRGFLNNASHFLNLLELWFGPADTIRILKSRPSPLLGDLNVEFTASFGEVTATFEAGDLDITEGEIAIQGSGGNISYRDLGASIEVSNSHGKRELETADYNRLQLYVLTEIRDWIAGAQTRRCSMQAATQTVRTMLEAIA